MLSSRAVAGPGVVPDVPPSVGPAFCPSAYDPCGTLAATYVPPGAPRARATRRIARERVQRYDRPEHARLWALDADAARAGERHPGRRPGVPCKRRRRRPALGGRGRTRRDVARARARPLPRAHALQRHGDPRSGIRGPRGRSSRGADQRGDVARLYVLPRPASPAAHGRRHRDARRHKRELDAQRGDARPREARRPRGDAARRGQPASPPLPSALRAPLRRPPLRSTGDRHPGDHPRALAGNACRLLPEALRSRVLRAGRRGTRRAVGGAGGGRAHAWPAAPQRAQAASAAGARRRALEAAPGRAAGGAGPSEHGVTDAELRRAVTAAEARDAFSTETAEGRAYAFGRAETIWRLEEELAYVDRLRSVTPDQIRSAARRYLDPERYDRVAFLPPTR